MSSEDYVKIRVGKHPVGIMGLKQILNEVVGKMSGKSEEEIQEELLGRLSKRNYISDGTRKAYGEAFLREYKKFIGEPVEEEVSHSPDVKVLGEGCARCNKLEQSVMQVMSETGIAGYLEHITDIKEISKYGVMGTPALVINGKVVAVGSVPSKSKIKKLLNDVVAKYR